MNKHVYRYFTLLAYAQGKYASHITQECPTVQYNESTCKPHGTAQTSKKKTATFIYDAITIYVQTNNMPLKCHI